MTQELRRTPLYEEHVKLGAKMVPFAGWKMPLSYKGIIAEHESVRKSAGIFDVGHMGIIDAAGSGALSFISYIATNNASLLSENEGQYTVLCNPGGGTVDDVFVFRLKDRFRFVINASNSDKVLAWFNGNSKGFENFKLLVRKDVGILSVQGPHAKDKLGVAALPARNHCAVWGDLLFSHTGYTGEDGLEIFVPADSMANVWETIVALGIEPCGLGARDTLRLESGLPLYGHEYDEETSPLEAGYPWAVKLDHDFIGKLSLLKQKEQGAKKKLVGLKFLDKAIPRQGTPVMHDGEQIGIVTSGTFSPTLKIPIALSYIAPEYASIGAQVEVIIRNKPYFAVVSKRKMV